MAFTKSKNTKRFQFGINRNIKSHKAGSNTLTIQSKDYDTASRGYSFSSNEVPGTVTMSVKEAKALQGFLNEHLAAAGAESTKYPPTLKNNYNMS